MLTEDLQSENTELTTRMEKRVKAIIQSYMSRMCKNELVYKQTEM